MKKGWGEGQEAPPASVFCSEGLLSLVFGILVRPTGNLTFLTALYKALVSRPPNLKSQQDLKNLLFVRK